MNKPKVFYVKKVYQNQDQASEHICQNGLSLLSLTQAVIGGSSISQSDVIGYHCKSSTTVSHVPGTIVWLGQGSLKEQNQEDIPIFLFF